MSPGISKRPAAAGTGRAKAAPAWRCCPRISPSWGAPRRSGARSSRPTATGPSRRPSRPRRAQLGLWIVAGTQPIAVPGESRPANACVVYDASGSARARYDKIHLFDVDLPGGREAYRESANATPGAKPVVVDTPAGQAGTHRLLRYALPGAVPPTGLARAQKSSACRPRSPARPGARTGKRCCVPGRSRTSAS